MKNNSISNIAQIANSGLCIGCGTCYSICPEDAISIKENKKLGCFIATIDEQACNNCGKCVQVCPALDFTINNSKSSNKLVGNYSQLLWGYSRDDSLRYRASSGGIVSSILTYLNNMRLIDGLILCKPSDSSAFHYETFISNDIEDIFKYAGTRYFPIPVNKILKEIRSKKGKYVLIGTPCQINGITKFEKAFPDIRNNIFLKIGLFCGGVPNINSYKYNMQMHKIKMDDLTSIYRGNGWPGNINFSYSNGKITTIPKQPNKFREQVYYIISFFPLFAIKRCILCIDRFASYADISVGDAWLKEFKNDNQGTSLIISRNEKADKILSDMKSKNYISCNNISEIKVIKSQTIFSDFYQNAYSTHKTILKNQSLPINSDISGKKKNFIWLIKLRLILIGMKFSEKRYLWKYLFIYGVFFRYTYSLIGRFTTVTQKLVNH